MRWALAFAFVVLSVPALAQNVTSRTLRPLADVVIATDVKLAWDRTATDAAPGLVFKVYDGLNDGVPVAVVCNGASCWTDTPVLSLTSPGRHLVVLTVTSNGLESAPSPAVSFFVRAPSCPYTPPGGALQQRPLASVDPVNGVIQGVVPFNKTANDNYAVSRDAQLRKDGWRVEWQVYNSLNTFLKAFCEGVPQ